ncbi:MAG: metallophosphoesterase [Anaerolineaceae bacterium]|nr:metallophosphoesterase [Anaerolineaceae bacterium]
MTAVYVIGDIHGQYAAMVRVLRNAGLIDANRRWSGGDAQLWFLGDFVDRGPDGIGVIELVMQLQNQAADAGGLVQGVIGNHDMLLLAAYRFGRHKSVVAEAYRTGQHVTPGTVDSFISLWLNSGGFPGDLARMTRKHVTWLSYLPAMARVGDKLLAHADSILYQRYADSIDDVNHFFRKLLTESGFREWDTVIDDFSEHRAFIRQGGTDRAQTFLKIFDCEQFIHGHTPISKLTGETATGPLVYADGLCVNIDQGLYLGDPGFIHQLA